MTGCVDPPSRQENRGPEDPPRPRPRTSDMRAHETTLPPPNPNLTLSSVELSVIALGALGLCAWLVYIAAAFA